MGFLEVLILATALLQREKRISCRALKRIFELDDDGLADLTSSSKSPIILRRSFLDLTPYCLSGSSNEPKIVKAGFIELCGS